MMLVASDKISITLMLPGLNHHLEGAGVEKISNQNTGWVAKRFVGCGSASAQRGCVDHVIVQQGCGVNELRPQLPRCGDVSLGSPMLRIP